MNPADGPMAPSQMGTQRARPLRRADDIAAAVVHLAGPGGRSITGTSILVDSGFNA